jgi:LDH2 family malate/lactate/ureidoglycolate dehydrogenase
MNRLEPALAGDCRPGWMSNHMFVKPAAELQLLVEHILLAAGADQRNAEIVANHLVLANLSGVDSHGIWHVPSYVGAIRAGVISPTAWPEVIHETPTSALVKGNWTFGHVAAEFGMERAIQKAAQAGIAVVGVVQDNHAGRLGHFVEMAIAQKMIAFVALGSEIPGTAAPFGGRERRLHTNPLAMGFPAGQEPAMMFDFATTATAGVKVINAYRHGQQLPPDTIIDKDGRPSTDPADFINGGALLPFGAHKGYALMVAADILGRLFTGAPNYADSPGEHTVTAADGRVTTRSSPGLNLIVLKADLFQAYEQYALRADELEQRIRAVPPAPGFSEVLVPGDPEARARVARQRDGIPIADDIWQSLATVAQSLGISVRA